MLGVGTAAALFDRTVDYCLGLLVMALLAGPEAMFLGLHGLPSGKGAEETYN